LLLLLLAFVLAGPLPQVALAEEEGGDVIERPLYVFFQQPTNGTARVDPHVHAVIYAGGATATFIEDDFSKGTTVNATVDETGVRPDAASATNESYYLSRVFEFPSAGTFAWSEPLDLLMGGGTNASLVNVSVRFGGRAPDRNWTEWYEVGVQGVFDAVNAANASYVDLPAMQYRVAFRDPTDASTPRVTFVEVWYLAPAREVSFRVGPEGNWQKLGDGEGVYDVNVTIAAGPNALQARVVDSAGRELIATSWVSYDTVAPTIQSAPDEGAVVPGDGVAEIVFSEPVDPASAAAAIQVTAPFDVDRVWSADGTRLFLSAADAPGQAQVTVTIGPGLIDRAGNRFNDTRTYHYTMGVAEETVPVSPLLVGLLVAGALLGLFAFWHAGRLKQQRLEYARNFDEQGPAPSAEADGEPAGGAPSPTAGKTRRKT
jgi:hypothetical protein